MIRTNIEFPDDLHQELKIYCAMNKIKLAHLIRRLVAEFLEKERKRLKIK